jgi:hypothetical protein
MLLPLEQPWPASASQPARLTSRHFQAGSTIMAKPNKVKFPGASLRKMLSTAPAPNAKMVKPAVKPFKMKAKRS